MRTLVAVAAAALAGSVSGPAAADGFFLSAGLEADDESGQLVHASVGGDLSERTSWDFAAASSDTSADRSGLGSTSYHGAVRYDFGPVGLRVGLGGWEDEGLSSVQQWRAALDFGGDPWRFVLEAQGTARDFDPFDVDRTIIRHDGSEVDVNARADCAVDAPGLGARLGWFGDPWGFEISAMSYDYDDPTCDFDLPLLDLLRRTTREEFVQLADAITGRLALGIGSNLLAETSPLDSRVDLEASYFGAVRSYHVYLDHFEDAFIGTSADSLSAGIAFVLASGNEIELYAGATDGDDTGTIAFLGFVAFFGF